MRHIKTLSLVLLLGIYACKVPGLPESKRVHLPENFPGKIDSVGLAQTHWKQFFPDALLVQYIEHALSSNPDYLIALQHVEMAQAWLYGNKFWFLPSVQGIAGAGVRRFGKYTMDGVGNYDTNFSPNIEPEQKMREDLPDFQLGLALAWEIDLWGKLRNQKKAARLRKEASLFLAQFSRAQLISAVAEHYYTLTALDAELEIIRDNIEIQQQAFEAIEIQKTGGRANELGVTQIEAQLLHTQGLEFFIRQEIMVVENSLRLLLGNHEAELHRNPFPDSAFYHLSLTSGKVAEFLQLRPDIREAELEYLASGADVNAARAAFFPTLSLQADAGFHSFNPQFFITAPASLAYQVLAGLAAPLFQKGEIRAQFKISTARQEQAFQQYRKTVMQAYLEVLTLMNRMNNLQSAIAMKTKQVKVLKESVMVSNALFNTAKASYLEILNAQQNVLDAELALVEMKRDLFITTLLYYRALGGGTQ